MAMLVVMLVLMVGPREPLDAAIKLLGDFSDSAEEELLLSDDAFDVDAGLFFDSPTDWLATATAAAATADFCICCTKSFIICCCLADATTACCNSDGCCSNGSKNDICGFSSLFRWIMALEYSRLKSSFSDSCKFNWCSLFACNVNDFVLPKLSLHMKHIKIGLFGFPD